VSQAELAHPLGDNIDQELLIWDYFSCFLEELSRHMAQGSDGAGRFRRELENGRRLACKSEGSELRGEDHKKGTLTLRAAQIVVNRFVRAVADPLSAGRTSPARRRIYQSGD